MFVVLYTPESHARYAVWVVGVNAHGVDSPWLIALRDLVPRSTIALAGIRRHKNRIPLSDGVNDIGVAGSFVDRGDGIPECVRGLTGIDQRSPNRCPAPGRNRRCVKGSNHMLASGDNVSWR